MSDKFVPKHAYMIERTCFEGRGTLRLQETSEQRLQKMGSENDKLFCALQLLYYSAIIEKEN